jgi:hypothetical protein
VGLTEAVAGASPSLSEPAANDPTCNGGLYGPFTVRYDLDVMGRGKPVEITFASRDVEAEVQVYIALAHAWLAREAAERRLTAVLDLVADRLEDAAVTDTATGRGLDACPTARARVSEASILDEVALVERVMRRLRRFVQGLVTRSIEVEPAPPPAQIDDPTRALARRLLERSGFVRVDP